MTMGFRIALTAAKWLSFATVAGKVGNVCLTIAAAASKYKEMKGEKTA